MNVFVQKDGQQYGPLSLEEVNEKVRNNEFHAADAAWIEDWTDWRSVAEIPGVLRMPPPFNPTVAATPSSGIRTTFPRAATISILCFVSLLVSLFLAMLTGRGSQSAAFACGEAIGLSLLLLLFAIPISLLARSYRALVVGLVVIGVLAANIAYVRLFMH